MDTDSAFEGDAGVSDAEVEGLGGEGALLGQSGYDGTDFQVLEDGAAQEVADAVYGDDDDFLGYETRGGEDPHDPLYSVRHVADTADLTTAMHVVDERMIGYASETDADLGPAAGEEGGAVQDGAVQDGAGEGGAGEGGAVQDGGGLDDAVWDDDADEGDG